MRPCRHEFSFLPLTGALVWHPHKKSLMCGDSRSARQIRRSRTSALYFHAQHDVDEGDTRAKRAARCVARALAFLFVPCTMRASPLWVSCASPRSGEYAHRSTITTALRTTTLHHRSSHTLARSTRYTSPPPHSRQKLEPSRVGRRGPFCTRKACTALTSGHAKVPSISQVSHYTSALTAPSSPAPLVFLRASTSLGCAADRESIRTQEESCTRSRTTISTSTPSLKRLFTRAHSHRLPPREVRFPHTREI